VNHFISKSFINEPVKKTRSNRTFVSLLVVFFISVPDLIFASSPIAVPPLDTIQSADRNVRVGVSRQYAGSIVYLSDQRISGGEDMIDYSNGGTLFTTAIWTLPPNPQEQQFCEEAQKANGVCSGTLPFNNPTQGGYLADGWVGNPNPSTVTVSNNRISVSYRAVNYNYDWVYTPLTEANKSEWQTDVWGDMEIYFHPTESDVVVVETKITYCKDMNPSCSGKTLVTEDNQLSTMFGRGQDLPRDAYPDIFRGPFTRVAYMSSTGLKTDVYGPTLDNPENWTAILHQTEDIGMGMMVDKYSSTVPSRFGYFLGPHPFLTAIQPEINNFEHSGVVRKTSVTIDGHVYDDIPRYEFQPGGWYKFKTYLATGSSSAISSKLLAASAGRQPIGYLDGVVLPEGYVGGWAFDPDDSSVSIQVKIYFDGPKETGTLVSTVATDGYRPDANAASQITGNHGFTISIPGSFRDGRTHNVYVYAVDSGNNSLVALSGNPKSFSLAAVRKQGDLNNDNRVDIFDYNILVGNFGRTGSGIVGDIDSNNKVDIFDYNTLVGNFGQ